MEKTRDSTTLHCGNVHDGSSSSARMIGDRRHSHRANATASPSAVYVEPGASLRWGVEALRR